jgi:hypothetical protein
MSHVPVWVYVVFFVLLNLGIKRCYTRVTTVERIAIVPVLFIFLSLHSTVSLFSLSMIGLLLWLLAGLTGSLLGHLHVRNRIIRADKNKRLIEIPGDISMLIMLMSIFAIEFFIHYAFDAHWAISQVDMFKNMAVILSGFIVGISIGRNSTYFLKYKKAATVELFATK